MSFLRYTTLAVVLVLTFGARSENSSDPDCACDPSHFVDNVNNAERVFRGKIVSGQLDVNADAIDFTVEVLAELRGTTSSPISLSTPFKDGCGLRVSAGAEWVFIQSENDRVVSRCDLQLESRVVDPDHLSAAVVLVDATTDLVKAKAALANYLSEGASASGIRAMLGLAHQLDPVAEASFSDNYLSFGNLDVVVMQGRVVSHVWH